MKVRRISALILALLLAAQLILPAMAAETEEEDAVGTITIVSNLAAEQSEWDAMLHGSGEGGYTILMKPEDIAAIAGVQLEWHNEEYIFSRGAYEVHVDPELWEAAVYLCPDVDIDQLLYGDIFLLPYVGEDEDGQCYLPVEHLFYLLNVNWLTAVDTVFAYAPRDTTWSVAGDVIDMYGSTPTFGEVAGETLGESLSNGFMYAILAIADEIPYALNPGGFSKASYETALNAMSAPAVTRLEELEAEENGHFFARVGDYTADPDELMEQILRINGASEALGGGLDIDAKGLDYLVDDILSSLTTRDLKSVGLTGKNILKGTEYILAVCKVAEVVGRSKDWSDDYLEQLLYLEDLEDERFDQGEIGHINSSAKSLRTEYANEVGTAVWETVKTGMVTSLDTLLLDKVPAYWVLKAYDGVVAGLRMWIPEVDLALESGDNAYLALSQYNISAITKVQYLDALDALFVGDLTQEKLDQVRITGMLMSNASAHCYVTLAEMAMARNRTDPNTPESFAYETYQAEHNALYATRLQEASQYDARLYLETDFRNLYSEETGATRQKIPEEYVKFHETLMGNTNGNLNNGGLAAYEQETGAKYYRSEKANASGLYDIIREDPDGTTQVIADNAYVTPGINVIGNWVYYIDGETGLDGRLDMYKGTFLNDAYENGTRSYLNRIRTDGTSHSVLLERTVEKCWVTDDYIYFAGYDYSAYGCYNVYRCELEGQNTILLGEAAGHDIDEICVDPETETVYYRGSYNDGMDVDTPRSYYEERSGIWRATVDEEGTVRNEHIWNNHTDGPEEKDDAFYSKYYVYLTGLELADGQLRTIYKRGAWDSMAYTYSLLVLDENAELQETKPEYVDLWAKMSMNWYEGILYAGAQYEMGNDIVRFTEDGQTAETLVAGTNPNFVNGMLYYLDSNGVLCSMKIS